jgi:hypothetical protein
MNSDNIEISINEIKDEIKIINHNISLITKSIYCINISVIVLCLLFNKRK